MLGEAAELGVQYSQRHLSRVEMKPVFRGNLQHPQMDERVLVAREAKNLECALSIDLIDKLRIRASRQKRGQ